MMATYLHVIHFLVADYYLLLTHMLIGKQITRSSENIWHYWLLWLM